MNDLTALSRNTQSYLETYNNIVSRMASRLETAPTDRSVSGSFLRHTLPMQEAAGEMCRNLLRYTTSLDLQRLADDVLTRQAHALEALRRAEHACRSALNTPQTARQYAARSSAVLSELLRAMESVPAQNSIDLNFIDELIPHQETSLGLTRLALRSPLSPALLPIANSLLRSHSLTLRRLREIRLTLR